MKKTTKIRGTLLTAFMAAALVVNACGSEKKAEETSSEEAAVIEVSVSSPQVMTLSTQSRYIGTVEADSTVNVMAKVSAEVLTKNFEIGDHVNEGDLLFTMDDTLAQITLSQAQAGLSSAQAGLCAAQAGYNAQTATYLAAEAQNGVTHASAEETLGTMDTTEQQMRAALETAEAKLTQAKLAAGTATESYYNAETALDKALDKYHDNKPGYDRDMIDKLELAELTAHNQALSAAENYNMALDAYNLAKQQLDDYLEYTQNTIALSAEAQIVGADQQLAASAAQLEASAATIQTSRAAVATAECGVRNAETALDYYTVLSPVSGTITAINVSEYNMAAPSVAAYTIQTDAPGKVVFYVAEKTMQEMSLGNTAIMEHDGTEFTGKVVAISDVLDAGTGLYKVEVQADNNSLLPPTGSSVNILTVARQSNNVLTVPENSIYYDGEQPYVYIQDGNTAKRRDITTGLMEDGNVEVIEGLISDDKVIVSWNSNMKDGAGIKVK